MLRITVRQRWRPRHNANTFTVLPKAEQPETPIQSLVKEVETLVDAVADTLAEKEKKRLLDTRAKFKVKALFNALANTLVHIKAKAVSDALPDTVAEKQPEKRMKRLVEVKAEELVDVLAEPLAGEKAERLIDTD